MLQCKSVFCLSVIMCGTTPSFSAVDSARSLSSFPSFTAINTFSNTFWAFSILKFPMNKRQLFLILSPSMLLIKRCKWLEKKMCHLCVKPTSQVSCSKLGTWHAVFPWRTKFEKLIEKSFNFLRLWKQPCLSLILCVTGRLINGQAGSLWS